MSLLSAPQSTLPRLLCDVALTSTWAAIFLLSGFLGGDDALAASERESPKAAPVTGIGAAPRFDVQSGSRPRVPNEQVIPGRLLVKVATGEIRESFIPLPRTVLPPRFPKALPVNGAVPLGWTNARKALILVELSGPVRRSTVGSLLKKAGIKWQRDARAVDQRPGYVTSIVVEAEEGWLPKRLYPQLKPDSKLNELFHRVGIGSIRRIHRASEVPAPDGSLRVVPVTKLLKDAETRYPRRAARGYPDIRVPTNMDSWFVARLGPDADLSRAMTDIARSQGIEEVSLDYHVSYMQLPQDEPEYPNQWALQDAGHWGINVLPAWQLGMSMSPVRVAVIGSGIKEDLNEFAGRIWSKACQAGQDPQNDHCEIAGNGVDDDANGYIDDVTGITTFETTSSPPIVTSSHETQVAGLIAANSTNGQLIAGVSGQAPASMINISLGFTRGCAELAEAILYATLEGADVANMSLGAPPNIPTLEAVHAALTRRGGGVTLVASAGNNARRVTQSFYLEGATYPAWLPGVISVGGTDTSGHLWREGLNTGSNYGVDLDLVAPASDVQTITYSASSDTTATVTTMDGTSASAAIVSGTAALVLTHYPDVRVEKMTAWLRATATDIRDPLGTGLNLTGIDEYTGAGLVNAGTALTSGQPDPVLVSVGIERARRPGEHLLPFDVAVIDKPDIAISVTGPVDHWQLDYGVGDFPSEWLSLPVPPQLTSGPFEANIAEGDAVSGHNYLDTDRLDNQRIYTLRLVAFDLQDRPYTTYTRFMPLRAMLLFPDKNDAVPTHWGWPDIWGVVDIRPGATYELEILGPSATSASGIVGPRALYGNSSGIALEQAILASPERACSDECSLAGWSTSALPPPFPSPPLVDGWHSIRLRTRLTRLVPISGGGFNLRVIHDTQVTRPVWVDGQSFPKMAGWPVAVPQEPISPQGAPHQGGAWPRGVYAVPMTASGDYRVFVHTQGHFVSLRPNGQIVFDLPCSIEQDMNWEDDRFGPVFLVDDLNGDGTKEILVGCLTRTQVQLHLLKPDGTAFNGNWPYSFPYASFDYTLFGKLQAADVDNDGRKEVIFVKRSPLPRGGESRPPEGKLFVMNLDAQPLPGWPVDLFSYSAAIQAGDVDGDGRADILVNGNRLYDSSGAMKPGWPILQGTGGSWKGGFQIAKLVADAASQVLVYDLQYDPESQSDIYVLDARRADGTRYVGTWPVMLDRASPRVSHGWEYFSSIYAKVGSFWPGGRQLIAVCYDKIKVLETNGSYTSGVNPIDLNGQCRGLDIVDVNGDGNKELVVLVQRYEDDNGWKTAAHSELEAYKLSGQALSATDNLWPVRVVSQPYWHRPALGNSLGIHDADGDGKNELINVLYERPYRPAGEAQLPQRHNLIEVLKLPN